MIRIEKIEITEFRGIRQLVLNLGKKNFGICGPNGTGKSGVVDAIEFAITGSITRLEGRGTSDLSVKAHAPHVDSRKTPQKAKVVMTAFIPSLNQTVTIERSVGAPAAPTITPTSPEIQAVMSELATHPEFALSRREIIKYILTPAGQRSKDVQELLRLEQIEKLRMSLNKVVNESKAAAKDAATQESKAKTEFLQAVGITTLNKEDLLQEVNEKRVLLQLPELTDLTQETSLKEGLIDVAGKTEAKPKIKKSVAIAEHEALLSSLNAGETDALKTAKSTALAILQKLKDNPGVARSFKRQVLVRQGLQLIDDDTCPLCDNTWDQAVLRAHLQEKLLGAAEADKLLKEFDTASEVITDALKLLEQNISKLLPYYDLIDPKIEKVTIDTMRQQWVVARNSIEKISEDPSELDVATNALSSEWWKLPSDTSATLINLRERIDALPDASKEEEARDYLVIAQERYERCLVTKTVNEGATKQNELAQAIVGHYELSSTSVLEGIYVAVEKDFTAYYRAINSEDEKTFDGKLDPSFGKLGLDVDFYTRGLFPPGAYHSEGHQDGMGLCLYLALMKHTLGVNFTFAVLDDVLMSVDSGHRREVCTLLRKEFPKTQFVLTTHDPTWLQFMRSEKLIESSVSFAGWSVETGPNVWSDGDIWDQIKEKLAKNDIPGAASSLRRYLEFTATVLANNLRAPVDFHGDGQYDFGDLMPPSLRAWRDELNRAKEAALSWGRTAEIAKVELLQKTAKEKIAATNAEQWMVNKAVHYSTWANLQKNEFGAVVEAYRALLAELRCAEPTCTGYLFVSPTKGSREALRCSCGAVNLSLILNDKPLLTSSGTPGVVPVS